MTCNRQGSSRTENKRSGPGSRQRETHHGAAGALLGSWWVLAQLQRGGMHASRASLAAVDAGCKSQSASAPQTVHSGCAALHCAVMLLRAKLQHCCWPLGSQLAPPNKHAQATAAMLNVKLPSPTMLYIPACLACIVLRLLETACTLLPAGQHNCRTHSTAYMCMHSKDAYSTARLQLHPHLASASHRHRSALLAGHDQHLHAFIGCPQHDKAAAACQHAKMRASPPRERSSGWT